MKTSKARLTLVASEKDAEQNFPQKSGRIIGMFVTIGNESDLPNNIVTATLENQDEKAIASLGVTEFKRQTGSSYSSSFHPLNEDGSESFKFRVTTKTAPTTDVEMEMVLVFEDTQC
jgi:hypothetical protein